MIDQAVRKKLIISAVIVICLLIPFGVIQIINRAQQPSVETAADPTVGQDTTPEPGEGSEDDHDHSEGIPVELFDGKHVMANEIDTTYKPFAETVLRAYIQQSTKESATERSDRLRGYFTDASPIPSAPPPAVDTKQLTDYATTMGILYYDWYVANNAITFTFATKVTTTAVNNPSQTYDSIYQSYDVVIVPYNGSYRVSTITYNPQRIILPS